jgi:hypothetical protein
MENCTPNYGKIMDYPKKVYITPKISKRRSDKSRSRYIVVIEPSRTDDGLHFLIDNYGSILAHHTPEGLTYFHKRGLKRPLSDKSIDMLKTGLCGIDSIKEWLTLLKDRDDARSEIEELKASAERVRHTAVALLKLHHANEIATYKKMEDDQRRVVAFERRIGEQLRLTTWKHTPDTIDLTAEDPSIEELRQFEKRLEEQLLTRHSE